MTTGCPRTGNGPLACLQGCLVRPAINPGGQTGDDRVAVPDKGPYRPAGAGKALLRDLAGTRPFPSWHGVRGQLPRDTRGVIEWMFR